MDDFLLYIAIGSLILAGFRRVYLKIKSALADDGKIDIGEAIEIADEILDVMEEVSP